MDVLGASRQRVRQVRAQLRRVLQRRGRRQGHPDVAGRPVLRAVQEVHAVRQRGQEPGRPVHCQARAEHRLRRRLRQAVQLRPGAQEDARRNAVRNHVR